MEGVEDSRCLPPQNNIRKGEMINRLNKKNCLDMFDLLSKNLDKYNDFYLTFDKQRIFLNNSKTIKKTIKYQEIYGIFEKELDGLLLIYRTKGYRPYVKILAKDRNSEYKLIRFLIRNFSDRDLYCKFKKSNPLTRIIQRYGFIFQGNRGEEILLFRKGEKRKFKLRPKDGDKEEKGDN